MGKKKPKKTVVPVYLKSPDEVPKREVEYNAQTQVRDAFDNDLDFLLNHDDEVVDDEPKVDDAEGVDGAPSGHQDTQRKSKVGKKPRSQVRQEILNLDFDLGFSSDEDGDGDEDHHLEDKPPGGRGKPSAQFMESLLQLSEQLDDLTLLSSDESVSDYFQLENDSDSEDGPQFVVSDEEEQIQLDEEFNNPAHLSKRFEALSVAGNRDGKKGQKKKKILFDEVGSNWEKLQKKMADKPQDRSKRKKQMNKQRQKVSQAESTQQDAEEGVTGKKGSISRAKKAKERAKQKAKERAREKAKEKPTIQNQRPGPQPQSTKPAENKSAKPMMDKQEITPSDSADQSTKKTTKQRARRPKKHPTALKTTTD
ncbi:unnamed protein product [Cyberlindnera jadinii]|uniref:Uncharacterized protein n=1 Tax=Cyberlindnera jadinii (strain ATCC 18201 / CBS 1600 / BCRC 20928 / JCM 3617 / NBRC 0987 / NRRL Y-1542) TaxID=983966 RepID=A0A0H5C1Q4_CYBJN|nr:unnamed protein product [Cyberlindnera jadinii]